MSSDILVVADANIPLLDELAAKGVRVKKVDGRQLTNAQLSHADALLVRSVTQVNEELLTGTKIRFVGTATAGTNHLDREYLLSQRIAVASAPGANAFSVGEYVLMFACLWMHEQRRNPFETTVGIVGWGNIGRTVGMLLSEVGCQILFADPFVEFAQLHAEPHRNIRKVELSEVVEQSTIVTMHVPLVESGQHATRGLIGPAECALLQDNSLLINSCRGGVVEESALASVIHAKSISVVNDVWENEPYVDAELAKTVWHGTPHIAGYSYNGKTAGARMVFQALESHFGLRVESEEPRQHHVPTIRDLIGVQRLDLQALVKHIDHQRQLLVDASNFKSMLELSDSERAKAFDAMRKTYPKRWESLRL